MKTIFFQITTGFVLLASSCNTIEKQTTPDLANARQLDSFPASGVYLAKDPNGNTLASWVRSINDSTSVFCVAFSDDDGASFGEPIVVPGSDNIHPHAENLPKVIRKTSGEIIALWGAANPSPRNKYAGAVYYAQSFDNGKNWSSPKPLVTDTAGNDQRYYDVALMPDGEAGIIWLDNRRADDRQVGSSLYFARTSGTNGFTGERAISRECCQCCRTKLLVEQDGKIHVLYRGIINDSIRDMVHVVSNNGGQTFSAPRRISSDNWVINACPHTGPAMASNAKGLHFAWYTGGPGKGCYYTSSNDNGKTYGRRDSVSSSGSHPQMAALTGGDIVITWDEPIVAGNNIHKRIGVEKRSAGYTGNKKYFLTGDTSTCVYPVIVPLKDNNALVAYTQETKEGKKLYYRKVNFK
jgi:hypothetical protein